MPKNMKTILFVRLYLFTVVFAYKCIIFMGPELKEVYVERYINMKEMKSSILYIFHFNKIPNQVCAQ